MAAALAAITGTAVHVHSIRAKRTKPGLRPQHLTGMQLAATLSRGSLEGGEVGSTAVTFRPAALCCCEVTADTGTAGSCMLLAQVALPCLLFAPPGHTSVVHLKGGTDAAMAPPVGYSQAVLLPTLRRLLHVTADLQLARRGFFPKVGSVIC